MTGVEDLLRSATREKATEISPESIPPLDAGSLARGRAGSRRRLATRIARWPRLAVPLAAAVAVVAVVALSIAVPRMLTGRGAADGVIRPNPLLTTGTTGTAPTGTIPPYYIALTDASSQPYFHPLRITVRSTMTGAALATVKPPTPNETFSLVAHGAGDDTFVVGVQPWRPPGETSKAGSPVWVTLMLLHFHPSTRSASFSALPVPTVSLTALQSVALSPDGTQLAVALDASPTLLDLDVFSLTGGGWRTWSLRGGWAGQWSIENAATGDSGGTNPNAMSWLPGGRTLAFNLSELHGEETLPETVRELDVDRPGGGLLADSRAVFTLNPGAAPFACLDALQLSADGKTVTCAGFGEHFGSDAPTAPAEAILGFAVFSVATGRLATIRAQMFYRPGLVAPRLFWQSGDTVIGTLRGPILIVSGSKEHSTPWDPPPIGQTMDDAVDAAW
jgi:hypothetical protein